MDKVFLHMYPDYGKALFWDEEDACCGDFESVSFTDLQGKEVDVDLTSIPELEAWFWKWERHTLWEQNYSDNDWKDWKNRGLELAKRVSDLLPDYVDFYYLWDTDKIWEVDPKGTEDGGLFNYQKPIHIVNTRIK